MKLVYLQKPGFRQSLYRGEGKWHGIAWSLQISDAKPSQYLENDDIYQGRLNRGRQWLITYLESLLLGLPYVRCNLTVLYIHMHAHTQERKIYKRSPLTHTSTQCTGTMDQQESQITFPATARPIKDSP